MMGMKRMMMACCALLLLLILAAPSAFCQSFAIDQGSKLISGAISLESMSGKLYENANKEKMLNVTLSPSVSYFIIQGLAVGLKSEIGATYQGNDKAYSAGAGPLVSYFLGSSSCKILPFVEASYVYGWVNSGIDYGDLAYAKATWTTLSAGLGANYMLKESVGVFVKAQYILDDLKYDETDITVKGNTIQIGVGLNTFFF
jgi:hypothetical protein